jgi:transcriptional regulator with XRE-family HTH domain
MSNWQGKKLQEAREASGLSRFQVAAKLDVTQAVVENWERGDFAPSGKLLADLADLVAIDPTELFEATPQDGYRTHSRISQSTYKEQGQAQAEAELAKLRQQVLDAEDAHAQSVAAYRRADPWDRDRETERMHEAAERLSGLTAKLRAHEVHEA